MHWLQSPGSRHWGGVRSAKDFERSMCKRRRASRIGQGDPYDAYLKPLPARWGDAEQGLLNQGAPHGGEISGSSYDHLTPTWPLQGSWSAPPRGLKSGSYYLDRLFKSFLKRRAEQYMSSSARAPDKADIPPGISYWLNHGLRTWTINWRAVDSNLPTPFFCGSHHEWYVTELGGLYKVFGP